LTYSLLHSPICSVLIAATIATGSVLEARKKNFSANPDFGRNPTVPVRRQLLAWKREHCRGRAVTAAFKGDPYDPEG